MEIRKTLLFGLVIMGLMSCSSSHDLPDKPVVIKEGPNMKVAVELPLSSSSRSDTHTDEVGTESENTAKNVLIALYDTNNQFVTSFEQRLINTNPGVYNTETFIAEGIDLNARYKTYLFVNPYPGLRTSLVGSEIVNNTLPTLSTAEATLAQITKTDEFFMSTANAVELIEVKETATNKATPYHVKANVERASARFDFLSTQDDNMYTISREGENKVEIIMREAKLINLSRSLYNLRRTNESGEVGGDISLGGTETNMNYVVDTDWDKKTLTSDHWSSLFFSPLVGSKNFLENKYTLLATAPNESKRISYATENTIPKSNGNKKGLATAVVFRGDIVFNLADFGVTSNEPIYVWNNTLYGVFDRLPPGVKAQLSGNGANSTNEEFVAAGVNRYVYNKELKGYPVYYVYYNKHNITDLDKKETGPMEFAVVRNNVYRLSVSAVKVFGHPNDPENPIQDHPDIDPEDPNNPSKDEKIYMDVTCKVLPWTVRRNTIEF